VAVFDLGGAVLTLFSGLWLAVFLALALAAPVFAVLAIYVHWLAMQALRKYLGKPPLRFRRRPWEPGDVGRL
jgi:membrane protein implicated in regulation of membrane protease activity